MEGPIEETGPGQRVSAFEPEDLRAPPFSFDSALSDDEAPQGLDDEMAKPKGARGWTLPRLDLRLPLALGLGIGAVLKVATLALGLLLVGGALRAAVVFGTGNVSGPTAVRGAGWTATNLEAFHVHDLSGSRVLVVRGRLEKWRTLPSSEGRTARPRIAGTLFDGEGSPVGEEVRARPVRLDDAALGPEALSAVLDGSERATHSVRAGTRQNRAAEGSPEGFTILFRNPPPEASRVRIQLRTPDVRGTSGS